MKDTQRIVYGKNLLQNTIQILIQKALNERLYTAPDNPTTRPTPPTHERYKLTG